MLWDLPGGASGLSCSCVLSVMLEGVGMMTVSKLTFLV